MIELSRLVRHTLPSTVRAILRFLFVDSLLSEYSYKGQKKKKVFSTLSSCSLIFGKIIKYYVIITLMYLNLLIYPSICFQIL